MKTVTFYGSSNDLVEISGIEGADEFGNYTDSTLVASFVITIPDETERLRVYAIYDGTWSFAPAMIDEDDDWPNWDIRVSPAHNYSTKLEIDVPDNAKLINHVFYSGKQKIAT